MEKDKTFRRKFFWLRVKWRALRHVIVNNKRTKLISWSFSKFKTSASTKDLVKETFLRHWPGENVCVAYSKRTSVRNI